MKHLRKTVLLLLTLTFLYGCGEKKEFLTPDEKRWLDEHKETLTISCDPGWPPFEYLENGKFTGFTSEYIKLVESRLGIKFRFIPGESWKQVMNYFNEKKIDLVPSIGEESTRSDYMLFTKPYYSVSTAIIVNTDEKRTLTLKDLSGKRVAVTWGYDTITTYIRKNHPGIKIQFVPSPLSGLRAVSAGILDAMIESPGVVLYYSRAEGIKNLRFAGDGERHWVLRMGVRSEYAVLRDILNKVITDIPDTEKNEMLNRWTGDRSISQFRSLKFCAGCLLVILPVVAAGYILIRYRKKINAALNSILDLKIVIISILFLSLTIISFNLISFIIKEDEVLTELSESEKKWLNTATGLRLSPNPSAPPLSYIDVEGNYNGLTMDYIREIEKFAGINFKIIKTKTFAEIIEKLKTGEIDIAGPLQITPERERYMFFSKPYITAETVIITRYDAPELDTLEKLKGKTVSVTNGYTVQKYLEQKYPSLTITPVPDDFTGLLQVSFGEKDAMVTDIIASSYIINTEGIINLKIAGKAGFNYRLGFAVNRNLPMLNSIVNKAMASITERRKREITEKWIGPGNKLVSIDKNFWIMLAGILSLSLVVFTTIMGWNLSLKKKVKQRTFELEQALSEVRKLQGFLPICSNCKKIRNDSGYWTQIEEYISTHSDAQFTHGICPDCAKKLYPGIDLTSPE